MSNGYPFKATRKFVLATIAAHDFEFIVSVIRLIDERRGWMASHKTRASKIIAKIAAGNLSAEDLAEAAALVARYARTISRILREKEIAERPELAVQAAVFGVLHPTASLTETSVATEAAPAPAVDATATEVLAAPPKRRPGRPKGSRNRVREDQPPAKRRRRS